MKKGFFNSEETFEDAIKINRCIEFIYKRKRYWIDLATIKVYKNEQFGKKIKY